MNIPGPKSFWVPEQRHLMTVPGQMWLLRSWAGDRRSLFSPGSLTDCHPGLKSEGCGILNHHLFVLIKAKKWYYYAKEYKHVCEVRSSDTQGKAQLRMHLGRGTRPCFADAKGSGGAWKGWVMKLNLEREKESHFFLSVSLLTWWQVVYPIHLTDILWFVTAEGLSITFRLALTQLQT